MSNQSLKGHSMKSFFILLFTLSLAACSGVKMITPERKLAEKVDTTKFYRQSFLQKMNGIKDKFRQGKSDLALKDLSLMKDEGLTAAEKSTRINLIGVINFSKKNYDAAAKSFESALIFSKDDPALESQINLNLGSTYYKLNSHLKLFS